MKTFEIANAKINLYLDVSRKREDGYHDVVTLMHQISLCDELWIEASESGCTQIKLTVDGIVPTIGVAITNNTNAYRKEDTLFLYIAHK